MQNDFFALLGDVIREIKKREGNGEEENAEENRQNGYSSEINTSDHNDSDFDEPVYDKGKYFGNLKIQIFNWKFGSKIENSICLNF